ALATMLFALGCGSGAPEDMFTPSVRGIWLIGWSGGLNHFSWARFSANDRLDLLAPPSDPLWTPYWMCSGQGTWTLAASTSTITVQLPSGCGGTSEFTFSFAPPSGFQGETLSAAVSVTGRADQLEGHKFVDAQCDAAFTACTLPR